MFDDTDSLLALMRDTALHAALLAGGAAPPPVHVWRARGVALVERLRQAMRDAGYGQAGIDEASLAQCVLLDDLTLRALPAGEIGEWRRESLQARFHGTNDGAARVWARIDALLRGERRDRMALAWYGAVLALGFEGGREHPDVYRRRALDALDALERRGAAASPSSPLVPLPAEPMMQSAPRRPAAPPPARSRLPWRNALATGEIVVVFAVVAAALWIAFDARLSEATDHLSGHDGAAAAHPSQGDGA